MRWAVLALLAAGCSGMDGEAVDMGAPDVGVDACTPPRGLCPCPKDTHGCDWPDDLRCYDLLSDSSNCGECGVMCLGLHCVEGECGCRIGWERHYDNGVEWCAQP